jgi:hypothetical protein
MPLSEGMAVIARSVSDEAIPCKNTDCFAALAMTLQLNLMPLGGGLAAVCPVFARMV